MIMAARPEHGVLALGERGGAGVVGLTGHVDPPAAVRPDVAADTDGVAELDQAAALLDVQLDERADPGERLVVAAEAGRVAAGAPHRLGHRHAVVVGEAAGPVGPQRPGDDPRARAGDAEPGALLVGEVDDPHGPGRGEAVVPQLVDRREGTDDPERAVEGATVGHRVEVRADDDAGVPGGHRGIRVAPPGPLVAHPVGGEVEPAVGALAGEPLAQVVVLAGPGEPVVARRCSPSTPEGLEVVPHPSEADGGPAVQWRRGHGVHLTVPTAG